MQPTWALAVRRDQGDGAAPAEVPVVGERRPEMRVLTAGGVGRHLTKTCSRPSEGGAVATRPSALPFSFKLLPEWVHYRPPPALFVAGAYHPPLLPCRTTHHGVAVLPRTICGFHKTAAYVCICLAVIFVTPFHFMACRFCGNIVSVCSRVATFLCIRCRVAPTM